MAVFGGVNMTNIQLQIQNAFSKPLVSRIQEIEDIIRITSTKELKNVLPMIVEGIFGFGTEIGWDVDRISKRYQSEFDQLRHFLSPEGPLLKLINCLQSEPYTYEFPFKYIPSPSKQKIEDGYIPSFYMSKIQQQPHGIILALSAFEFYMFHFAYALVNTKFTKTMWPEFYDYVYPNLIDDYLTYFMPLDKKHLPAMPHSSSPVRSPVSHFSSHSPGPSPSASPLKSSHGLFKSSFTVSNQRQHVTTSPVLDHSEAETWRSETMLQIWCEFWLNQNVLDGEKQRSPGDSVISSHSLNTSYDRYPIYLLYDHFMPTANHVNVVRVLVKYVHYFVNTASNLPTSISPIDDFKKMVIPQILQKKLYTFLKHAFDHWPLDSSFKMVLEIWLSYIQPWRYTDYKLVKSTERTRQEAEHEKNIETKWFDFVEDNLLFYSVLFQEFLPRVYRLDLLSFSCAIMLHRVSKVFSKSNLPALIERAEKKLCSSAFLSHKTSHYGPSADLTTSYFPLGNVVSAPPQFVELESPGFQYIPLLDYRTQSMVNAIIEQTLDAKTHLMKKPASTHKKRRPGFWGWVASFFDDDTPYGERNPEELVKQKTLLSNSIRNLCKVFKLPVPADIQDSTMPIETVGDDSLLSESTIPDYIQTETGPQLTDLGRYQVANGLKKFDVLYHGDPDLEPIKSYENASLVRFFYYCCQVINTRFSGEINRLYNRRDFVGRMSQSFISPPLPQHELIRTPVSPSKAENLRKPRLSLRFMASYKNIVYFGLLFLLMNFWYGLGPVGFMFFLMFGACVYAAFIALVKPRHNHIH